MPPEMPPEINVKQIALWTGKTNAIGDGITDDTAAIQSALTVAKITKKQLHFVDRGTYIVSATLDPTGVSIEGNGATLKIKDGITAPNLFQSSGAFSVRNLTIDMNKANTIDPGASTVGCGIYAFGAAGWSDRVVIENVTIINGYQPAIRLGATAPASDAVASPIARAIVDRILVNACKFGVHISNISDVTIRDSVFTNMTGDVIWTTNTNRLRIAGNKIITSTGHGITTAQTLDTVIEGNIIRGCTGNGIALGGGSTVITEMRRNTVIGNVCEGNTLSGITLDPAKSGDGGVLTYPSYCAVNGNICNSNGIHGIVITHAQYVAVTGNVCRNNANSGIGVSASDVSITGNVCTGNTNYGVGLFGNAGSPNYGYHKVSGNQLRNNTGQDLYIESSYVVEVQFADSFTATSAQLNAIDNVINTTNKTLYKQVMNSTTNKPVFASGITAGAVWNDATGALAHTPV